MSKSIICDRSFEFAARALAFCDSMSRGNLSARHLAHQLMKSATSIGANAEEAQEGQTKKDFIAKLSIARREARETTWWLRLIVRNKAASGKEIEWLLDEANQLLRMIRSAVITARRSKKRKGLTDD